MWELSPNKAQAISFMMHNQLNPKCIMKYFFLYVPKKTICMNNMKISIENKFPTKEEYNHLREQVDCNLLENNIIETAFRKSLYCVSVRQEGELKGFFTDARS